MSENNDPTPPEHAPTKSDVVRDALVFQFKLMVDGIRDFILIPVSIGAAILSLIKPGSKAGSEFYDVVALGRATERKINLFSAADKMAPVPAAEDLPDLDTLVGEIETFVKKEYEGDRFAAARERLNRLRETVRERDRGDKPAEDSQD